MELNKNEIFKQISDFNSQKVGKTIYPDFYWYVDDESAIDSSSFFDFIKNEKNIDIENASILDFAFGSGNLTSHIVLDNLEKFKKVTFNDINEEVNINFIDQFYKKAELSAKNFLKASLWPEKQKYDIIIFNPQIGGDSYPKGDSKLEKKEGIISSLSLKEYFELNDTDISEIEINESDNRIDIHSNTLLKMPLKKLVGRISIFNYKDVFYQSKTSNIVGNESNTVKFRATFNKVFNSEGIAIFYGDDDGFNSLFADFNTVYKYKRDNKNLYIAIKEGENRSIEVYKKENGKFEIYTKEDKHNVELGNIDLIQGEIGTAVKELSETTDTDNSLAETKQDKEKIEPFNVDVSKIGNIDFPYKNILLKGVPGTGKSRLIDVKLLQEIGLKHITHPNILRVNIHSASSNSDLMQGIGVSANKGNIEYNEKQGLILNHLKNAISKPNQAFAIVLEEIQENNLNELIGDLIYLIEEEKRSDISNFIKADKEFNSYDEFIDELVAFNEDTHFVQIPYLVSSETKYRKLIIPNNLYFFCTSNYRDDKKIIEDNLLRRFTLIELYPKPSVIEDKVVANFFKTLNERILEVLDGKEIHTDRFLIGHAYWINVKSGKTFYQALLKTITEFKDIREIEFSDVKKFFEKNEFEKEKTPFKTDLSILRTAKNYKAMISEIQEKAFGDLLKDNEQ